MKPTRPQAVALLVAAALLWSLGGLFTKWIAWHPLAIAGGRSAIAGLVIWLLLGRPRLSLDRWQLATALAYAGVVTGFVLANKLTTAANAIMLQYTAPLYVAFLAPLYLGEPTRWWDWLCIAVLLCGMGLFFMDSLSGGGLWGNLVAAFSGFCFGVMVLLMRHQRRVEPFKAVILGNALAALLGLPFMILAGLPSLESCLGLGLLGLVQLGPPYYLYVLAITRTSALEAVLIPMIEPVCNPIWVFLVLGETPGGWAILGGLLVLAGALGRGLWAARRPAGLPPEIGA